MAPIFLVGAAKGSVALVASVPKEMTSKFQANKIIQEIAPIVGGKGGGRPESAQGAGKDASKIAEAARESERASELNAQQNYGAVTAREARVFDQALQIFSVGRHSINRIFLFAGDAAEKKNVVVVEPNAVPAK